MPILPKLLPLTACLTWVACSPASEPSATLEPVTDEAGTAPTADVDAAEAPDAGAPSEIDAGRMRPDGAMPRPDGGRVRPDGGRPRPDAGPIADGGGGGGEPTLGTVTPLPDPCTSRNAALPGTTCSSARVSCPGLPDIDVDLRFSEPPSGTPVAGTVVMGVGGNGTGFYLAPEYGPDVRAALTAAGYRLIERSWPGGGGWYGDNSAGLRANACRYATLLRYLHDHEQAPGTPLCITGNSGGAAEVGYALTTWGVGAFVDMAAPSGGPAVTRLDYVCSSDPAWLSLCDQFIPDDQWACTPSCTLPPTHEVCTRTSPTPTPEELRADSVMHEDAVTHYPDTFVHFLYGTADCGPNVPSGMNWATQVTSPHVIDFVPNMPHAILTSAEGRDALIAAISGECRLHH